MSEDNTEKKVDILVGTEGREIDTIKYTNIPPKLSTRNEHGLLEGVNYVFKPNGRVDWKAMIKPEFLVFNREKQKEVEEKYGKPISELKIAELEDRDKDKYLLILLAGIRDLVHLRGCYAIETHVDAVSDSKSTATTKIRWVDTYEKECNLSTGVGSASFDNTNSFAKYFLESIAENRSFVRAVRQYLEINILGQDEIKVGLAENPEQTSGSNNSISPNLTLTKAVAEIGLDFTKFKARVIEKYKTHLEGSEPEKWNSFSDIAAKDCYALVGLIKEAKAKAQESSQNSSESVEGKKRGRPSKVTT